MRVTADPRAHENDSLQPACVLHSSMADKAL